MKTYYNDTVRKVTFEDKSIGLPDANDYFKALSDDQESYIGFIDVYDEVIIFKWIVKNKWMIDHPLVPNTLHKQCYATDEECLDIIEKIYQERDITLFKEFEDVPVQEFTLDEMLQFKKEDEALLNEEEIPTKAAPIPLTAPKPVAKKSKKNSPSSMIMGEQLGITKNSSASTSSQPKQAPVTQQTATPISKPTKPTTTPKTPKPDEDSFFSL